MQVIRMMTADQLNLAESSDSDPLTRMTTDHVALLTPSQYHALASEFTAIFCFLIFMHILFILWH